jgi:hypothetical protein
MTRNGLAREGFDIDLRDGECSERSLEHIIRFGTVEVKRDEKCRQTGNIFIEFSQKGRPSGIAVTTADFWAIEFADDCYVLIPTRKLKALARSIWKTKGHVNGGDYNNYCGVLVPWDSLKKIETHYLAGLNVKENREQEEK